MNAKKRSKLVKRYVNRTGKSRRKVRVWVAVKIKQKEELSCAH